MIMDKETLKEMLASVESLIAQAEGNPWGTHLRRNLVPVKVELERQLRGGR